MIILDILFVISEIFLWVFVIASIILMIRSLKYQRLWNKQKAMIVKVDPAITRAELCEQYVMFCIRNNCKVEY